LQVSKLIEIPENSDLFSSLEILYKRFKDLNANIKEHHEAEVKTKAIPNNEVEIKKRDKKIPYMNREHAWTQRSNNN